MVAVLQRLRGLVALTVRFIAGRVHHEGPLPFVGRRPTTNPVLPVADMDDATAFYQGLGFEVSRYDDGYAWVRHCGWEYLHLRLVDDVAGNAAAAYLHVDDTDHWHRALSEAARSSSFGDRFDPTPVVDTPWGMREFSFADPAGNTIRIGSNR